MHPGIILLDEPTSQLDRKGKENLCSVLIGLKRQGISIIIAEHNIEPFVGLVDRYFLMDDGRMKAVLDTPPDQYRCAKHSSSREESRQSGTRGGTPVIDASELCFCYSGNGTGLHDLSLEVAPGELVHIYGENGCGKSTLLKILAGALQPDSGNLRILEKNSIAAGGLIGTVALLFQNPQRQLFEDSVYDEVGFTLKRLGLQQNEIDARVKSALSACETSHLAERLPLTLSFGEQHRVALASIIAPDPRILLLDEPFAGLDPEQRLRLLHILSSLRDSRGTSIIIASHDPLPDPEWADRIIPMEDGKFISKLNGHL
ncbi:ATP-binding cassette domain-containing protein [bacterium]|nr:MAG: ATP-binding cassette domain-containing protein [bacterium]